MFSFVKFFFILIVFLFISSCHEKDYNIFKEIIMKDRQGESLEKLDTQDSKKPKEANSEKQNRKAGNLKNKNKKVDSLETKKLKKKKNS